MLNDFTGADQVYIACGYTDLRKGIDGLARLVQQQFELDPFTNCLSRENGRKPLKTLAFCRVLWYNICMENREMQTSNTAEMVTISRAEYERLQQKNVQLKSTRVRLEAERIKLEAEHARLEAKLAAREQEQAQVITSLTLQNEWLLEQLKLSKKKLFGRSSEQAEQMVMEQLSFTYNEAEAYASGTKAAAEKPVEVRAHARKRQSGNVLDVVPEGARTEVVEHRLPENERICSA